jgi:protein-tyrosine-phosphatase
MASPWIARMTDALPPSVAGRLRALRDLPASRRHRFALAWLLGRLGASRGGGSPSPPRVLFVCFGNIIRSALAEVLARRAAGAACVDLDAASAGLTAIDGRPADTRAIAVAAELGVSLDAHRARSLTDDAVDRADFIFVMDLMDHSNEAQLVSRYPAAARRVHLLQGAGLELVDPYAGTIDDVRASALAIDRAVRQRMSTIAADSVSA